MICGGTARQSGKIPKRRWTQHSCYKRSLTTLYLPPFFCFRFRPIMLPIRAPSLAGSSASPASAPPFFDFFLLGDDAASSSSSARRFLPLPFGSRLPPPFFGEADSVSASDSSSSSLSSPPRSWR